MNKTKLILGTIVLSSTLLAGCANTKLEQSVADLNTKVDQLATDVGSLRTDVQDAKAEAARANQRLDNMATSYKK
ncbi:murein lipoprotein [Plesiomonas shigelloides]|uniref:Major outer membrane lipoprotein Lpp n=2 Tax=Plesiomonas shigelloides TaxID=703 RepID=R8AVC8_PLESH|nr:MULTISPECIES: LPP leucine zipper domain-containing protein [Plesiomonas]AVQ86891.1 murein lipoprotein [Plesiomonas shigelloides]EON90292.1 murein lipoprotein [Plesiomonas shigelloides 302-73]KAB7659429.1 murein lipoprotein [Plesiomonas shigelloides]KAB7661005.1 murein lipoprotein [Plesiomonas shigelloides]KAB7666655.1 murein lipoprotein [Plesiomonas shigelloides]